MAPIRSTHCSLRGDIVFVFALALGLYLAWLVRDVLVMLYVSALFAVALTPLVRATAEIRIRDWQPFKKIPVLILLVAGAGALTAFGFLAFPPVLHDLQQFSREVPSREPSLLNKLQQVPFFDRINTDDLSARLQGFASKAATYVLLSITDWAGKLFDLITVVVLTVYFILEGDRAYRWFLSFFSPVRRHRLNRTLEGAELRMGKWLLGQGTLMLILGIASTTVYAILHVRYAYALGVLTGLLNFIPFLGAAICIGLALIVAAIDSWGRVLGVAIFYLIYIQVENSYLTPRIMHSAVKLPGLAIIVALLLGFELEGVLGAMVAVPTAVLVAALLDEYLVHKEAD